MLETRQTLHVLLGTLHDKTINNYANKRNPLYDDIATLNRILHMDEKGQLNNVHIKISKRQPPSVGTRNNMLSGAHLDQNPAKCNRSFCDICPVLCMDKIVELYDINGNLVQIRATRFSCKTSNVIYFIFLPETGEVLYIGHTGQSLLTRLFQHRGGKKRNSGKTKIRYGFVKNSSPKKIHFKITCIAASPYRVKRLETERFYINLFRPAWNCQLQHYWWQDKSYENTD